MRKKKDPQASHACRREAVTILAAATRGAIDRYFELFHDELERIHHSLQVAERWAERGGEPPRAVSRYRELANGTPPTCSKAEQALSRWSLLGLETSISAVFDLMLGRGNDLDAAFAQLETTIMDLTGNALITELIMAHAFARAGYAPGAMPKRNILIEAQEATHSQPSARNGLRVLAGGRAATRIP